jgi:hypothetical protein
MKFWRKETANAAEKEGNNIERIALVSMLRPLIAIAVSKFLPLRLCDVYDPETLELRSADE